MAINPSNAYGRLIRLPGVTWPAFSADKLVHLLAAVAFVGIASLGGNGALVATQSGLLRPIHPPKQFALPLGEARIAEVVMGTTQVNFWDRLQTVIGHAEWLRDFPSRYEPIQLAIPIRSNSPWTTDSSYFLT